MGGVLFDVIEGEGMSVCGVGSSCWSAMECFGVRVVLCGPAGCRVRRPPSELVMFLLGGFGSGKALFGGSMLNIGWGISCLFARVLSFVWVALYFR